MLYFNAARVLIPFITSFVIGIALTPVITHYLYKHKVWKKIAGKNALDGKTAEQFNKIDSGREAYTPRMGGIVIWGSVICTALLFSILSGVIGGEYTKLNLINRGQTWLPLFALISGAIIGLGNDILDVTTADARGLSLRYRLLAVILISGSIGWWFYFKLGVSSIGVVFFGTVPLGILFIPFFVVVTLLMYASGVIDGIDGLAGGVFGIIFMVYAGIAFAQNQVALAALSATISGATFAFLWFNIPPARFWMTETGTMALTLALSTIAFCADTLGDGVGVSVLPIIALPLFVTVISNVLQVISKKYLGRKLFRIAPVHHHFEAIGWPSYKVTMRYWVITILCGFIGLSLALLK